MLYSFAKPIPSVAVSGFDPDAAAFFAAVTGAGGSLTLTEKNAVNTLVLNLKSNLMWSKMVAIYPYVGGSLASCKFNLKDPRDLDAAYRITFSGGWTFASTGINGNGISYANTHLANTVMGQDDVHISCYSRTNNDWALNKCEIATYNGSVFGSNIYAGSTVTTPEFAGTINGMVQIVNPADSLGLRVVSRPNSTDMFLQYKSTLNSFTGSTTNYISSVFSLGSASSSAALDPSDREEAFQSIGFGLDATECGLMYTIVQGFQTTLGRQV